MSLYIKHNLRKHYNCEGHGLEHIINLLWFLVDTGVISLKEKDLAWEEI